MTLGVLVLPLDDLPPRRSLHTDTCNEGNAVGVRISFLHVISAGRHRIFTRWFLILLYNWASNSQKMSNFSESARLTVMLETPAAYVSALIECGFASICDFSASSSDPTQEVLCSGGWGSPGSPLAAKAFGSCDANIYRAATLCPAQG